MEFSYETFQIQITVSALMPDNFLTPGFYPVLNNEVG